MKTMKDWPNSGNKGIFNCSHIDANELRMARCLRVAGGLCAKKLYSTL